MGAIFVTKPGQVVALTQTGTLPLTIFMEDWPGFPSINAIITQISGTTLANVQFLHSLKEYIYVYVFGERVGDLTITGLTFSDNCSGQRGTTGLEQLSQYYDQHRVSKTGKPIKIQIGLSGKVNLSAFLIGMKQDIVDPALQIGQFTLICKTFPPEANRA